MDAELYAIQKKLKELGHDPGTLDGVWGPDTRRAVAAHLGVKAAKVPGSDVVEAPWMVLARAQLGLKEVPGSGSSADIIDFYKEAGVPQKADSVPWCAAFVGAMLKRAGYKGTGSLMARSYLNWGSELAKPRTGCVAVFKRGAAPAGHVAFVEEWSTNSVKVLGGNQSDAVTVASYSRASLLGFRWPSEVLAA
jgi:uncharacterized protein (TIGR02594 family)